MTVVLSFELSVSQPWPLTLCKDYLSIFHFLIFELFFQSFCPSLCYLVHCQCAPETNCCHFRMCNTYIHALKILSGSYKCLTLTDGPKAFPSEQSHPSLSCYLLMERKRYNMDKHNTVKTKDRRCARCLQKTCFEKCIKSSNVFFLQTSRREFLRYINT